MTLMTTTVELELELRYVDDTDERVVLQVDCEGTGPQPGGHPLVISDLQSDRDDATVRRLLDAVYLAIDNWCSRQGCRLVTDPGPGLVAALGLPTGPTQRRVPTEATSIQCQKFERFGQWDLRHAAMDVLRAVIDTDGLERSVLGETWGVTAFPSRRTALRLNVGPREVLVIRSDGAATLNLMSDPGSTVRLPDSVERTQGFKALPESVGLTGALDVVPVLLDIPAVTAAHRALIEASVRRLPQANWHNPLVGPLLFSPASA